MLATEDDFWLHGNYIQILALELKPSSSFSKLKQFCASAKFIVCTYIPYGCFIVLHNTYTQMIRSINKFLSLSRIRIEQFDARNVMRKTDSQFTRSYTHTHTCSDVYAVVSNTINTYTHALMDIFIFMKKKLKPDSEQMSLSSGSSSGKWRRSYKRNRWARQK